MSKSNMNGKKVSKILQKKRRLKLKVMFINEMRSDLVVIGMWSRIWELRGC